MRLMVDNAGFPALLAETPPAEVVSSPPISSGDVEIARRRDAVREAAREFENFTTQDVKELLKGRTTRALSDSEISDFLADVKSQVLDDLVDALDQAERGTLRGRRTVRVTAPRGYVRKTVKALSDDEFKTVLNRLEARGWTTVQLSRMAAKHNRQVEHDSTKDIALSLAVGSDTQIARQPMLVEVQAPAVSFLVPRAKKTKRTVERDDRGLIASITTVEEHEIVKREIERGEDGRIEGVEEVSDAG